MTAASVPSPLDPPTPTPYVFEAVPGSAGMSWAFYVGGARAGIVHLDGMRELVPYDERRLRAEVRLDGSHEARRRQLLDVVAAWVGHLAHVMDFRFVETEAGDGIPVERPAAAVDLAGMGVSAVHRTGRGPLTRTEWRAEMEIAREQAKRPGAH